jgi:hypothetical protein
VFVAVGFCGVDGNVEMVPVYILILCTEQVISSLIDLRSEV